MKFQQPGINYDDPKYIRQCIDVGNARGEADSPAKMLFFAVIEDAYLLATGQTSGWKKPCREPGCNGTRTNQQCALAWFDSKEFAEIADLLNINLAYFHKLMRESNYKRPKRQYRKGTARKEVLVEEKQGVENRSDTGLPGEAGSTSGAPDLGGALLRGEAPGCDSLPGGLCGYVEPERVGQGETEL